MPNSYFQFKQFIIHQNRSGMKVTTDACLFGAAVAEIAERTKPLKILDIGTGTGLLALMLAQKTGSTIDAIELEEGAFEQARENFANSPWVNRLEVYHISLQRFFPISQPGTSTPQHINTSPPPHPNTLTYDLIICNPPFFSGHLTGKDTARNRALHNDLLPFPDLAEGIARLLSPQGTAHLLLPDHEMGLLTKEMQGQGLHPMRSTEIFNAPGKTIFRRMTAFGKGKPEGIDSRDLYIRQESGEYSDEFRKLLSPYYLHL